MSELIEPQTFGEWLRDKRIEMRMSQKDLVEKSNGVLKQATLSSYEKNKVKEVTVLKILAIGEVLGLKATEIPWHLLESNSGGNCSRLGMYELPLQANSVKLFNGKVYEIQGFLGKELKSGQVKKVSDIYYHVRTATKNGTVCAKRKKPQDELRLTI